VTGRRAVGAALLVVSTTTMSGCDWKGPNSLPLPGTAGGGPDGYSVTVQLADVTTLDRNARVRVGDVTVGRIADIRLGPGFAEVTVDPDGEVRLPRNATARVGQSSLLGASHLELSAPPGNPPRARCPTATSSRWNAAAGTPPRSRRWPRSRRPSAAAAWPRRRRSSGNSTSR
jgi:phospholipid/cholesterol/gamma-HCH transport system substrate-binding protein